MGEYRGITVVTGAIDQIAGAIGAGIVKKGIVSEMTGTTMVIFVPSEDIPKYTPNSKIPCHVNFDGKYCLLSWTPTAGIALKWFKNNFCNMHISGSNIGRNLCILRNEKRFYKRVISIFRRRNAINYSVCVWIHMECTDSTKNKTKK